MFLLIATYFDSQIMSTQNLSFRVEKEIIYNMGF